MTKRAADDSMCVGENFYDFVLPKPKWPRVDEPEKWTAHDQESAMMVNTLSLDAPNPTGWIKCAIPNGNLIKVSQFMQALDLANFDDWDIILTDDLENLRVCITIPTVTPIFMDGHTGGGPQVVPPPQVEHQCPLAKPITVPRYIPGFRPKPEPQAEPELWPTHVVPQPSRWPTHTLPVGMLRFSSHCDCQDPPSDSA